MGEGLKKRECGECNLCCKLLAIKELEKPSHVWCKHIKISHGCTIYEDRPPSCKEFFCLWMLNLIGEKFYPLKTKVVARIGTSNLGETVYLNEDVEGHAKKHMMEYIHLWINGKFNVIIIYRNKPRTIIPMKPI